MTGRALRDGQLQQANIDRYWDEGFLHPIRALSDEAAAAARSGLEAVERDWLAADMPQPLNTYKRVNAHVVMPFVVDLCRNPAILDVVEGILGPDILIYAAEFFAKEPKTSHVVTMHQDLTYWGLGAIDGMVTAWVALSPATRASGCMDFVRGSHKNPILPHEDTFDANNLLSRGQEIAVDVAPEDKTAIEIHPGQISLHHGLTIHGSGPNTTDDRRIAAVIRYVAPEVMPDSAEVPDYAMLVRGEDTTGNFTLTDPPKGLFTPEDLDLYEKIRIAQAEVKMQGAKGSAGMYA